MTSPRSPAAILLAAGASSRMGTPKALLPTADDIPLAARQLLTLHHAGYAPLLLVTGRHDAEIRAALTSLPSLSALPVTFLYNSDWPQGRLTSVQAALRALLALPSPPPAALILPVDAAGIAPATFAAIRTAWQTTPDPDHPIRPTYDTQKGNALLLPAPLFPQVLALPPSDRLDRWARPLSRPLPLPDPALLANYNTPSAWSSRPSCRPPS